VFNQTVGDVELWQVWENIRCPVLILRGEQSDVLTEATATEMQRIHPKTQVVTFAGVGHAPTLLNEEQQDVIENWLRTAKS
jgi:pimeloyl-ACP methyl ester carboxylesterase